MPSPIIPTPRYIDVETVQQRIDQVVSTSILPENGSINIGVMNQLIAKAEAMVETDLQTYFIVPFVTIDGQSWDTLATSHPTAYNFLFDLFVQRSMLEIYLDYFGSTGANNRGNPFIDNLRLIYRDLLSRLTEKNTAGGYLYLNIFDGLKPNPQRQYRQMGGFYSGSIGGQSVTSSANANKLNDPNPSWWNGRCK